MNKIRFIAAALDTRQLVLYKADGSTIVIMQGDGRITSLVNTIIPAIRKYGFCELTEAQVLYESDPSKDLAHYAETQKKMGGVVKFFRMAKAKLAEITDKFIPVEMLEEAGFDNLDPSPKTVQSTDAVAEIMANAISAADPKFNDTSAGDTTVVAVTSKGNIFPGMENLDIQLRAIASKLGSPVGIMKFFERLATVNRQHTVQDLLAFMEKGELPIADDGTILVYKLLRSTGENGVFVDCHTGRVTQQVGSKVCMQESMVDKSRHNECSNGLHVARRDYLSSFSGDVCVLAKLAPEDVIAVPHDDPRKLRARAYFIIDRLSDSDMCSVQRGGKMTDTVMLGNAVAGNHTAVVEVVEITEQQGKGIVITPMERPPEVVKDASIKATPLATAEEAIQGANTVDPRAVAVTPTTPVLAEAVSTGSSHKERIQLLLKSISEPGKAQAIWDIKKKSKKGWAALGVSAADAILLVEMGDK